MNRDEIIGKLLYVPFNDDYRVDDRVRALMTNEEFFEHCFIQPNFVEGINKVLADHEINDFEIDIEKRELVKRLEKQRSEEETFHNWIVSRQSDLYCIKGDAGTGKTTYLHYLKYHYSNSDVNWYIIDMQKAVKQIYMLGNCIKINDFDELYSKAISTIVMNISSTLFIRDKDSKKINHSEIYNILKKLKQRYNELFVGYYPREEISSFYNGLPEILDDCFRKENNERFAAYISNQLTKIINQHASDRNEAFEIILELYVYLLRCINDKQRYIIAFDNFERFINTWIFRRPEIASPGRWKSPVRTMEIIQIANLFALGFIQAIYLSHRDVLSRIDACYVYLVRIMHYSIKDCVSKWAVIAIQLFIPSFISELRAEYCG